jgi:Glycosyl transferases group 1
LPSIAPATLAQRGSSTEVIGAARVAQPHFMPTLVSDPGVVAFHQHEAARVAVVSLRATQRDVWRALPFEFEDLITSIESADLVGPTQVARPDAVSTRLRRAWSRLTHPQPYAAASRPLPTTNRLYELLFVPIGDFNELFLFPQLKPWLECSRVRVAWLMEVWSKSIAINRAALDALRHFDVIAVGCENSVEPLQKALGKPCFYLPAAVDTIRAMPAEPASPRHIDVWQMGRRSKATHKALLDMSSSRGWFYQFDTSWAQQTADHVQHRLMFTNTLKRTRFFIANRAKVDAPEQTGGQQEVGFRFFEGAAGGAVMIGEVPDTPAFKQLFGWDDAVIPLPFGSDNIGAVIDDLLATPERIAAIHARNVRESLLRHDWAYRWHQVLDRVGLVPQPALLAREKRLAELASRIQVPEAGGDGWARREAGGKVVRLQRG